MENIIDEILKKDEKEKLKIVVLEMVDFIKRKDITEHQKFEKILYTFAFAETITPNLAEKWVNQMRPKAKWTREETDDFLKKKKLLLNPNEFFVAMNLMYSDYNNVIGDDVDKYIIMAIDFLKDEDAVKNKLYNYYFNVTKHNT